MNLEQHFPGVFDQIDIIPFAEPKGDKYHTCGTLPWKTPIPPDNSAPSTHEASLNNLAPLTSS